MSNILFRFFPKRSKRFYRLFFLFMFSYFLCLYWYKTRLNSDKTHLNITFNKLTELFEKYSIKSGGHWKPFNLSSQLKFKVAIIVPYRDRLENFRDLLRSLHPFLIRQNVEYSIYVIEPLKYLKFNRGLLKNIGFIESLKDSNDYWDCFFFHDVDAIPLNVKNLYQCNQQMPVHHASFVSLYNYHSEKMR